MAEPLAFMPDMPAVTRDYLPSFYLLPYEIYRRAPPFTLASIANMLTDPRIIFGLYLIKGPILSKSRFFVKCDQDDIRQFLIDNISRFWRSSVVRALKALEWGWSCSEVLYEYRDDLIQFQNLKDIQSVDTRAISQNGRLVMASVRGLSRLFGQTETNKVYLHFPKFFWHVHQRDMHPYYGRSRLRGAYLPWVEAWTDGGYRDARRLFYHKYAFSGGGMYHPPGERKITNPSGQVSGIVSCKDLARRMLDNLKTGGTWTLPSEYNETGQRQWEFVPPEIRPLPENILELGRELRDEELEGMGIPPEMARPEATGPLGGGNGRSIAAEAFHAILQDIVNWMSFDLDTQILAPLVWRNFGEERCYEIIPFSLLESMDMGGQETPTSQGEGQSYVFGAKNDKEGSELAFKIQQAPYRNAERIRKLLEGETRFNSKGEAA